ncbi:hypothetical protein CWI36_0717p0010 [Hamiltosporidium magnivora]|uniref:Uncharacterized protein n=1 Tax=Hamiltosporidium magnivora TaxID=148818 RepID=A0A4Q9LB80_9MICR|nr:hypothetical protein CWI36_0717p0010 [Hamiltosporidium magnivora]
MILFRMKLFSAKICLYLFMLSGIKTNNTIILYFYENHDYILPATDFNSNESVVYSEFINEKYKFPGFCTCKQYSEMFIWNRAEILLKFKDPLESKENSPYKIYIQSSVLSYQEFIYFYKILCEFPCLIDNFSYKKLLEVLQIFDIFKFIKNEFFDDFIRFILTSVLYSLNDDFIYNSNENVKDMILCVDLSRIVILQLFELFICKNICLIQIDDYHKKILSINENFLYLDVIIILEINRMCVCCSKLRVLLEVLLSRLAFQDLFISKVSGKYFVSKNTISIFFAKLNEIIFYKCSEIEFFLKALKTSNSIHTCKSIGFIECKFNMMEEYLISELKSVKRYIIYHSLFLQSQNLSDMLPRYKYLEKKITKEIFNPYNVSNFTDRRTSEKLNMRPLTFQQNFMNTTNLFNFNFSKYPFFIYLFGEIKNHYIDVIFLTRDSREILSIELRFKNFFITGFKLTDSEIYDSILDISLSYMELNDKLLTDVLIFPKLENLNILNSNIIFEKNSLMFKENENIINFKIINSTVSKEKCFFGFLCAMINLESLNISSHRKFSIFNQEYNNICSFKFLKRIKYNVSYILTQTIPDFSSSYPIDEFTLGEDFPGGTLSKIFEPSTFNLVRILTLDRISIDKNDKLSLCKFKSMHTLTFISCKIKELNFYELFNTQENYIIENLYLKKLSLRILDLYFIRKLKSLKRLSLSIFEPYHETYKILKEIFFMNYKNLILHLDALNTSSQMDFKYRFHEEFENDKFSLVIKNN